MTTNLAFVITESFTFHFYLEKWIVPLSYDYNVHIIGRFSDEEIVNLSKKFSIYSIKFHTVDIQRKISWKNDFLSIFSIRKKILQFENLILFSLMPKANFLTSLCVLFTPRIKFSPIVTEYEKFINFDRALWIHPDNLGTAVRLRVPSYLVIFACMFIVYQEKIKLTYFKK